LFFVTVVRGLADEALKDAIYASQAMRNFVGVDLSSEDVPDATTLLKSRRLLENQRLTEAIFEQVGRYLEEMRLRMKEGTIVDATIIAAPSSTKNASGSRDPEMHQTRKGNQWYLGMKAHIGMDAQSRLVHRVRATAAHVSDVSQAWHLLHGEEKVVHADAGYQGVERHLLAALASTVDWRIAAKRGQIKALTEGLRKAVTVEWERRKALVRARVEYPFTSSKTSSAIARCAIAVWPKTSPNSTASSPWPTCS
jgi:IS5 family transposase